MPSIFTKEEIVAMDSKQEAKPAMAELKQRVEIEVATMKSAIEALGYLHIDEAKSKQLLEIIKDLTEQNEKLSTHLSNMHNILENSTFHSMYKDSEMAKDIKKELGITK